PDLNDFIAGIKILLGPAGTMTTEFPHVMQLIKGRQFDTIYHEHLSYFSMMTAERALAQNGLKLFDVETLSVHGGSLRLYVCHSEEDRPIEPSVSAMRADEHAAGLDRLETYRAFASVPPAVRSDLV